jgi:asparagine synthase (glutamine-hydrolysing)
VSAIAGIYNINNQPINHEHCNNLMIALEHYPFDDIHTWKKDNIFLGCHNQWITPESVGERLPFYDNERRLVITSDAIIDNRNEMFERLQVNHSQRKTITDSELILMSYLKWGRESPKYLIGDFAFMIWDERTQILFGARDFSGTRTLYYYQDQYRFAFCTTIKPLFTLPYVGKSLNEDWLAEFLVIPGMVDSVDTSITVYQNIQQLPPSHSITIEGGKISLNRFQKIYPQEKLKLKTNAEYEEAFRDVFETAVTEKLRTHGKVGSQLSGGLDSGTIVSFAAKALLKDNKQLHTYSYIPEKSFIDWTPNYYVADERTFIKETVKHVGNIKDYYMDFPGKSPLTEIDTILDIMEMPYKFFENSFWLKEISERAQQDGIKVLLNGSRGNYSISWGSKSLTLDYYASLLKKLKWVHLFHEIDLYSKNFKIGKSVIFPIVAKKAFPYIVNIVNTLKDGHENYQFPRLIHPNLAKKTNVYEKLQQAGIDISGLTVESQNEIRKKHFDQLHSWNKSGTIGTKLSLRTSMWDRDPTNDLRVIRFCLSLPENQYVKEGFERSLIRRATKKMLPDMVRLNQQYRGIQCADLIHRMSPSWSEFIEELKQLVRDPIISEILHIKAIKNAILKVEKEPRPEYLFDNEFRVLTRSLTVYRFIKNL